MVPTHAGVDMSLSAVVQDTAILGTFTGSRVSEYAQTQRPNGIVFHNVQTNATSRSDGENPSCSCFWISSYFLLLAWKCTTPKPHSGLRKHTILFNRGDSYIHFAHICNYPAFSVLPGVSRCQDLQTLGAHQPRPVHPAVLRRTSHLTNSHMTHVLRAAALRTNLKPLHLVYQHIASITGHSLRVFACLFLRLAG